MLFITEIEIANDFGNLDVVEVVTDLPTAVAEKAKAIYAKSGGRKSHDEIVAEARGSATEVPATR